MQELITSPTKKSLKIAAKVSQVAKVVSQIPQPKDFALMITGDIIYLSGKVQEISRKLNIMMDSYTDVPFEFLEDHINSVFDSTTSLINKFENYTEDNIINTRNKINATKEFIYDGTKDITSALVDLGSNHANEIFKLSNGIKDEIGYNRRNPITERNTQNALNSIGENSINAITDLSKDLQKNIDNVSNDILNNITDKSDFVKNEIASFQNQALSIINKIKSQIKSFSDSMDSAFGVKSMNAAGKNIMTFKKENISGSVFEETTTTLVNETTKCFGGIIENFSIGKFISGCASFAATTALLESGIMDLPKIDVERMLSEINGKRKIRNKSLPFDDLVQYDDKTFNKYKEKFEEILKKQRDEVRLNLSKENKKPSLIDEQKAINRSTKMLKDALTEKERSTLKSAIKEIRKKRRKARSAKITNKIKNTILDELKNFHKELKQLWNNVKKKWYNMMHTYEDSVKQIKECFTGDGPGNKSIDDICDDINLNFDKMITLCTVDLPVQISNVSVDISLPRAFGMCVSNFAQHIVQFFAEVKVIITFIGDIMRCIKNIVTDIRKLINIIMAGFKSLKNMINQLKDLFKMDWLLNLFKNTKNLFNNKMKEASVVLENSLQPVYVKDTQFYKDAMDNLYKSLNTIDVEIINDVIKSYEDWGNSICAYRSIKFKDKDFIDSLENYGTDEFTGYTIPIQTGCTNFEPEGYYYYHSDLVHRGFNNKGEYTLDEFKWGLSKNILFGHDENWIKRVAESRMRFLSLYIYNAANRNDLSGGVNMLKSNRQLYINDVNKKSVNAIDAFFWYYTEVNSENFMYDDPPCVDLEGNEIIPSKQQAHIKLNSDTGSVVTIDVGNGNTQKLFIKNASVKKGDYVNYNGRKYKIV